MASIVLAQEQALFLDAIRIRLEAEPDMRVVGCARTGNDAVAVAEQYRPDVVVLSGGLGTCGYLEAAQTIGGRLPATGILLLATDENPATVVSALEAGITGLPGEACSIEVLLEAIRCVQRGGTWISSRMVGPTISFLLQSREDALTRQRTLERLSNRERAVLTLVARGHNNESIAQALMISPQTAKTHVQNVLRKLGVHSRIAAAAFALQDGTLKDLDGCR